jgi:hypothetical protein
MSARRFFHVVACCAAASSPAIAGAQHVHGTSPPVDSPAQGAGWHGIQGRIGLMAIGMATRVTPAYGGLRFDEGYLAQPNLMADLRWRTVSFVGVLNGEAYTLERGELNPGIYGEGYVDRRHPHTTLHEAMLSLASTVSEGDGVVASVAAGKGFVPYGTDDPMTRPFVKYPVNHHHAQLLERAQVVGALRLARGGADVTLEAAVFNGDEPTDPFSSPQLRRVGDSRAARLTIRPFAALELQASTAHVESPEIIQGGANDHDQLSASVRWEEVHSSGRRSYAFAEFARTDEMQDGHRDFRFESVLAEALTTWRGFSAAARWERTARPEHRRLLDPFRSPIGHIDFQILGITRFTTTSVHIGGPGFTMPRSVGQPRFLPFVEVAHSVPRSMLLPTVFEPQEFYGGRSIWSYSAGLRFHLGSMHSRMGRYGAALPRQVSSAASHHH